MFGNEWPLFSRFDALRRELDRLWDGAGLTWSPLAAAGGYPALNIWDNGDALCVEAEVPGVRKEDLEVFAVGNELTVKGQRQAPEGEFTYHRQERGTGAFTRVVTLACEVDPERVEAVLDNGVLTIRLPKAEAAKPRQIAVKVN